MPDSIPYHLTCYILSWAIAGIPILPSSTSDQLEVSTFVKSGNPYRRMKRRVIWRVTF